MEPYRYLREDLDFDEQLEQIEQTLEWAERVGLLDD